MTRAPGTFLRWHYPAQVPRVDDARPQPCPKARLRRWSPSQPGCPELPGCRCRHRRCRHSHCIGPSGSVGQPVVPARARSMAWAVNRTSRVRTDARDRVSTSMSAPAAPRVSWSPDDPEPVLSRCAEQVEHQPVGQGQPADVRGDRRGGLVAHARGVVDAHRCGGHRVSRMPQGAVTLPPWRPERVAPGQPATDTIDPRKLRCGLHTSPGRSDLLGGGHRGDRVGP